MESVDATVNSSLGILDLADTRLDDCLTDMENRECSFTKTLEKLHRKGAEKLKDLTADMSNLHFGDQSDGNGVSTEEEENVPSRLDSMYLKPCTDFTQSSDVNGYSACHSTPKEKSEQSSFTNKPPPKIPSFGLKSLTAVGVDDETELSIIPRESRSVYHRQKYLQNDEELTSSKENKAPQERSIEKWRKAASADSDISDLSFRKKTSSGHSSQESFKEIRKKFEMDSKSSSGGSTLKTQKSPGIRRSLSLDNNGHFGGFDRRNTGFSELSIDSGMFQTGANAMNAIDEDEKEFREKHRFEISGLSDISTIPPDFSHVSDPASGDYFYARSEKVGQLGKKDVERPSLGLQIESPPFNPLGIARQSAEESLFGSNKKPESSNQPGKPTASRVSSSTVQGLLRESIFSSASTATKSQAGSNLPSESSGRTGQQPLHVYVPVQDRVSPCCHSSHVAFQFPPVHPWVDQGPCYPQFHSNSGYRGPPYSSVPSAYNQPAMAQEFFKMVVQAELPVQLVCVHVAKEVDLLVHNPSYQTFNCHVRVMHITALDSVAVKLDVMANCEFIMPGNVEVKGGTTQNLKMKCSFKLAGMYRVHLEIISESLNCASSSSLSAFTVEAEEPNVEMSSGSSGGNCIDFGRILSSSQQPPRFIRLANKTRASVPMKISISSVSDVSQIFLFPPELLHQLVASTSHTWLDVLPTFIVFQQDGQSTLDIPVAVDTSHLPTVGQGEAFVGSVQLSLKGQVYRTKHLMKICATLYSSMPSSRTAAQYPPVPSSTFSRRLEESLGEEKGSSVRKISLLASRKRSLYFPGVQVGLSLEKAVTLMNKSQDTKLMAQLILISSSPQPQYFIREGDHEYGRIQNVAFEPQQKKDFTIVFRPTSVASSSCSLQVKACTATRRMDKQDFLVPICGYGGASQVTMICPNPSSLRKAHLLVSPLNKGVSEHTITLRNGGSRAAFVAVLPLKDGQIELDHQVSLSMRAFVILPGETMDVKVTVRFKSRDDIYTFIQYLSFLHGDEQLRKILKNKVSSCDSSDRRFYDGPGLMKALDILQPFQGEEAVPRDELYREFKKEVAEVFYETVKVYDVVLSTNVDISEEEDHSFFSISNLTCSYGSLLNSTVFNRDNSPAAYGMSPPIRDVQNKK